jgi:hypothetical protein
MFVLNLEFLINMRIVYFIFIFQIFLLRLHAQNDSVFSNSVNVTTFIVDFNSYQLEGGNISSYECPDCSIDTFPLKFKYFSPDYGGVNVSLVPSNDTIFRATIINQGLGHISFPNSWNLNSLFENSLGSIEKPSDVKHYYYYSDEIVSQDPDFILMADSAWNSIKATQIANLYGENSYKAGIYLYNPVSGFTDNFYSKWVIFLYNNLNPTSTSNLNRFSNLELFPNPAKERITLNLSEKAKLNSKLEIFNNYGQLVYTENNLTKMQSINVSDFISGFFIVKIYNRNGAIISINKFFKI